MPPGIGMPTFSVVRNGEASPIGGPRVNVVTVRAPSTTPGVRVRGQCDDCAAQRRVTAGPSRVAVGFGMLNRLCPSGHFLQILPGHRLPAV
jgi:hypothetical protein